MEQENLPAENRGRLCSQFAQSLREKHNIFFRAPLTSTSVMRDLLRQNKFFVVPSTHTAAERLGFSGRGSSVWNKQPPPWIEGASRRHLHILLWAGPAAEAACASVYKYAQFLGSGTRRALMLLGLFWRKAQSCTQSSVGWLYAWLKAR